MKSDTIYWQRSDAFCQSRNDNAGIISVRWAVDEEIGLSTTKQIKKTLMNPKSRLYILDHPFHLPIRSAAGVNATYGHNLLILMI